MPSKFGGVLVEEAAPVSRFGGVPLGQPKPVEEQAPSFLDNASRAAGLTLRSILEGGASLPLAVADLAAIPINAISRAINDEDAIPSYQETFSRGLTEMGVPSPKTGPERLISSVGKGAASVAGGFGVGQVLTGAEGIAAQGVGNLLKASPGVQVASGAGAGVSAETAKELGFNESLQMAAGVVGGLATGLSASALSAKTPSIRKEIPGSRQGPPPSGSGESELISSAGAQKLGLEFNTLSDDLKDAIRRNADEAIAVGSDLTPDAVARKGVYESLGIQPTRALITRNFDDALKEQNLLTEPEGAALRSVYDQNNKAIRAQIKTLGSDADPVTGPVFGEKFRSQLIAGERGAQKQTNSAFNKAVLEEGDLPVESQPLVDYLQDNAAILNTTNAGKPVVAQLKQLGVIDEGNMIPLEPIAASPSGRKGFSALPITLKELSTIRKTVNDAWKGAKRSGDGVAASKLNDMRKIINDAEGEAGGELFKAYRTLRVKKGQKYENNPLIDDLIADRKGFMGTDKIEDSEVFGKAILRSTPEQFNKLWPRILPKARQLTRDQVSKYIEDTAFSNMGTNESGDVVASAAKLSRAINQIGKEKLKTIYGAEKAKELDTLSQSLRELSNPPRGTVPSGSAPKLQFLTRTILNAIGSKAGRLLGLGDVGSATEASIAKGAASRENLENIDRAMNIFPAKTVAKDSILAPVSLGIATGTQQ